MLESRRNVAIQRWKRTREGEKKDNLRANQSIQEGKKRKRNREKLGKRGK